MNSWEGAGPCGRIARFYDVPCGQWVCGTHRNQRIQSAGAEFVYYSRDVGAKGDAARANLWAARRKRETEIVERRLDLCVPSRLDPTLAVRCPFCSGIEAVVRDNDGTPYTAMCGVRA